MNDQAEKLREKINNLEAKKRVKTIAVISGKGGVGKSNVSLNFCLTLAKANKRVLLFDMDIGMGNIDILLGGSSQYSIIDLFERNISIDELVTRGPNNLDYIAAGSGLSELFTLDSKNSQMFIQQLEKLIPFYDYIIFDMGAGMSKEVLKFLLTVDEIFIITTPEPTAIMDAYSAMKYVCLVNKSIPFYLIVNRAQSEKEGINTLRRIEQTVSQFLLKDIIQLGYLPDDKVVTSAVKNQTPFVLFAPKAEITKSIELIVQNYQLKDGQITHSVPKSFLSKLKFVLSFGK